MLWVPTLNPKVADFRRRKNCSAVRAESRLGGGVSMGQTKGGAMTRGHVLVRLVPGLEAGAVEQIRGIQGVQATETLVTADV